ncbi:MAG: hypothetical protein P8P30_10070 [Rickettsiales bacterium]|nr:hypothetical protein [Rickettsiales bacterium]
MEKCFVCENECKEVTSQDYGDKRLLDCPQCGQYELSGSASTQGLDEKIKPHLLSSYLRSEWDARRVVSIKVHEYEKYAQLREIPLSEKTSILLNSYAKDVKSYTEIIDVDNPKYIAQIAARSAKDYWFVMEILYHQRLIRATEFQAVAHTGNPLTDCFISALGWAEVESQNKKQRTSQCFIAMWFDDSMTPIWEDGIKAAFEDTEFKPLRIDNKEHNDKIDDEIIAEIKRSRFIVADFTNHRGGVYFEAGFALGLGIPVIWTCRKDDLENLHFDIRQYNTIAWENADELKERLHQRIRATIS